MPRLLFVGLGARDTKRYILAGLAASGYQLVLVAERAPAWVRPYVQRAEAVDLSDPATAVDRVAALGASHRVAGVFTCDEAHVELAAAVAGRLGLRGLTARAARLCRDKHAMRRAFAEAGVPSARSVVTADVAEALRAAEAIGYPVVLKPRNLGGSVGVVRADGPADVNRYFDLSTRASLARMRALPGVLVEEYLDGPELSVESVVADGVTTVCGITEKLLGFAPFFEEVGHVARCVNGSDPADARVIAVVRDAHRALGLTYGATHTEVRCTAAGPRIVEIGGRVAGDRIPRITQLASGIDQVAGAAAVLTGGSFEPEPTHRRVAGIRMLYPERDGVVRRLEAKQGILGPLAEMGWSAEVGQRVALPPRGFLSRLGYLIAVADTRDEVIRRLDEGESMLAIEIEPSAPGGTSATRR